MTDGRSRALVVAFLLFGCASGSPEQMAADRALDYLALTGDEVGADVVIATRIYADARDDERASSVARAREAGLSAAARDTLALPLAGPHPTFPSQAISAPEPLDTPDPTFDIGDDRDRVCPLQALSCTLNDECAAYLQLDAGGYTTTHQALTLVFALWAGCDTDDATRHRIGARLAAEMRAYPAPGDLAYERMAMLGQLGFASSIERAWLDGLIAAQLDNGCLPLEPGGSCHPHPTGLALWTLAHAH